MDISKLAVLAHFAEQVYKLVKKIERDVKRTWQEEELLGAEEDSGKEEDAEASHDSDCEEIDSKQRRSEAS